MLQDLQAKMLCAHCVGESYLSALIATEGRLATCSYCELDATALGLDRICEEVDGAFQRHFTRARMEMNSYERAAYKDEESSFEFEPSGEPIVYAIANVAEVSESVSKDIQHVLEEQYSDWDSAEIGETTEYAEELYYEEVQPSDTEWQRTWRSFEKLLKTEARFFSATALEVLNSVFEGIDAMETRNGGSLIVEGGPGTPFEYLYRARAFQSPSKLRAALLRPDKELGPTPSALSASGRMNAKGISVFYGATDPDTAVAEVRPPVGSEVALGRFQVTRPLRLLDLTALAGVVAKGSYFDPGYAAALERMMFLRSLSRRMARPVMPDDQDSDYLPTQAIADFLATDSITPLDGIIFPSVQVVGRKQNVVLFHKASLVESLVIPEGAEINVDTFGEDEDGSYRDYQVVWRLQHASDVPQNDEPHKNFPIFRSSIEDDTVPEGVRATTLRITPKDLEVRVVRAVVFETERYQVRHVSYTMPDRSEF